MNIRTLSLCAISACLLGVVTSVMAQDLALQNCTIMGQGGFCIGHAQPDTPPTVLLPGTGSSDGEFVPSQNQENLAALNGSGALTIQSGNYNRSMTTIINSPGTLVQQQQLGNLNQSDVFVAGGGLNHVDVRQQGNGYLSDIYLIDSNQTQIRNNTSNYTNPDHKVKRLFVLYAKPGTVINVN